MATEESKFDPTEPTSLLIFLQDMPYKALLKWRKGVRINFKYANNREPLKELTNRDLERKVLEVSITYYPKQSVTLYLDDLED